MDQLSIFGMFWNAGPMVKFVMLLLLGFSVTSWYIIFRKFLLYKNVRKESADFLEKFWQCKTLAEASDIANNIPLSPEAAIFRSGYTELQKLSKSRAAVPETEETFEMRKAGMDNLKRVLRNAESMEMYNLYKTLPFLATTGSSTPFIGLFGTVWGIMTSFHEIGMRGSASLAVVAPGISEALVATAAGLAVAIPAVVFYNYYSNQVGDLESTMQSFSSDLLNLIERDIISRSS